MLCFGLLIMLKNLMQILPAWLLLEIVQAGRWRLHYALVARDRKGPAIDFQVLINPVVDNTWGGTLQLQGDEFDSERWIATQYVKNPKDTNNPYVSPIFAKDLSNLPPALIILAEKDMFRKGCPEICRPLACIRSAYQCIYSVWRWPPCR